MVEELSERFEERFSEITAYLEFLEGVDSVVQSGVPRLGGAGGPAITTQQQRILYSGVYLQLYNLVEATITGCLDGISRAALAQSGCTPAELTAEMRREWVRHMARTHVQMGPDKRLEEAIALCDHLVGALPVAPFDIERGGGGNWHDGEIRRIAKRLGVDLRLSRRAQRGVREVVRNDLGAMALVVNLRNALAHGSLSFAECGQYDTAADLTRLAMRVGEYLREVVVAFTTYIEDQRYLRPVTQEAPGAVAN
jgi:hypothetical protein